MNAVVTAVDAFFNAARIRQDQQFYSANERRARGCFQHQRRRRVNHFFEGQATEKKTHLMNAYYGIQEHFEDLKYTLLHLNRENEHFMWDHRTKEYSSILVAATIMISSLVAALGQGVLHEDSPDLVVMLYSVTLSLSAAFLFLCDVLCIEVIRRGSGFMRNRLSVYHRSLSHAVAKTKEMVHMLRGVGSVDGRTMGKPISHMNEDDVEDEFLTHEKEIQHHHDVEHRIIDQSNPFNNDDDNQTFDAYWEANCHVYGLFIIFLFYAGSIMMIFANLCFMWATYEFKYDTTYGSEACFHTVMNVVVATCGILLYMRYEKFDDDLIDPSESGLDEYSWGVIDFKSMRARFGTDLLARASTALAYVPRWVVSWVSWVCPPGPETESLSRRSSRRAGYGSVASAAEGGRRTPSSRRVRTGAGDGADASYVPVPQRDPSGLAATFNSYVQSERSDLSNSTPTTGTTPTTSTGASSVPPYAEQLVEMPAPVPVPVPVPVPTYRDGDVGGPAGRRASTGSSVSTVTYEITTSKTATVTVRRARWDSQALANPNPHGPTEPPAELHATLTAPTDDREIELISRRLLTLPTAAGTLRAGDDDGYMSEKSVASNGSGASGGSDRSRGSNDSGGASSIELRRAGKWVSGSGSGLAQPNRVRRHPSLQVQTLGGSGQRPSPLLLPTNVGSDGADATAGGSRKAEGEDWGDQYLFN